LTGSGRVPLDQVGEVLPKRRAELEDGRVTIKHGKVFVKDGTVRVLRVEDEGGGTGGLGTATVKDGKVTAVTGGLTPGDGGGEEGEVQGGEETPVLQPGEYTLSANKVSLLWQALAYLLLTVAEILISVTGLELAFVAAPRSMKSFVTGMWLATVGLANLFINAP